jgi:hypothetical protein
VVPLDEQIRHYRALMTDYDPTVVDVLIDRCDVCGQVALRRTALGERPLVNIRWRVSESATCDHMVVESLSVTSR